MEGEQTLQLETRSKKTPPVMQLLLFLLLLVMMTTVMIMLENGTQRSRDNGVELVWNLFQGHFRRCLRLRCVIFGDNWQVNEQR